VFESGLPVCGLFWVGRDDQCDGNLYLPVLVGGANLVRPSILLGYVCRQNNYIILKKKNIRIPYMLSELLFILYWNKT